MLIDHHHLPAPVASESRHILLDGNADDLRDLAEIMGGTPQIVLGAAARDVNEHVAIREENPPTPSYRLTHAGIEVDAIHETWEYLGAKFVHIERADGAELDALTSEVEIEVRP